MSKEIPADKVKAGGILAENGVQSSTLIPSLEPISINISVARKKPPVVGKPRRTIVPANVYECPHCGQRFGGISSLKDHLPFCTAGRTRE